MIIYKVSVLNTKHDFFDYIAEDISPVIGARVWVPFRNQIKLGIVVELEQTLHCSRPLKKIESVLDETPLITEKMLELAFWVSHYYQSPLSQVLALMIPKRYRLGQALPEMISPSNLPRILSPALSLNEEQASVFQQLIRSLDGYRCFLLYGVTGSGKTEIYLQVIADVLARDRQVLILVPEIGLTPQLIERFQTRFQEKLVVIHSHLKDTQRQAAFALAQSGDASLVLGTRSAVFTPMPKLGLIVIDEEHDLSFKQMEGVRYSARDTALIRAHRDNIPIILGSATPSLESLHNSQIGKYQLLRLNHKAATSTPLRYHIVDTRNQRLQHGLAASTLMMMNEVLQQGNQVLVFINRRGYAPVLLCQPCGFIANCVRCDTHMTFHREDKHLVCHHCGLTKPLMKHCPSCQSHELIPIGSGTQRIDEYLKTYFPNTSILRIDRDVISRKKTMDQYLNRIHSGEAQLIIGTQMLAKGHHFPRLTMVVVLDADNGFHNQDFRALEHFGQLLIQVSGRAGREEHPGQVVIQTYVPEHPMLRILVQQGYSQFATTLLSMRQDAKLPPYAYLALFRAECRHEQKLKDFMFMIKNQLNEKNITILGPAPAPLARKASQHRMQLLLKSSSRKTLSSELSLLRKTLNKKPISGLRWNIDVDPLDLS